MMRRFQYLSQNRLPPAGHHVGPSRTLIDKPTNEMDATSRSWLVPIFVTAGLAGYPVASFLPEAMGLDSRIVTVPYRALVLSLALLVLFRLALGHLHGHAGRLALPLMFFWALYLLRMMTDLFVNPVASSLPPQEILLYGLGVCFVPMLAFFVLQSEKTILRSVRGTIILLALGCFLGIYDNLANLGSDSQIWANTSLNTISFGHVGASVCGLSVLYLLQGKRSAPFPRVALLGFIPLGLTSMFLAGSRGPAVALAVMLLVLAIANLKRGKAGPIIVLLIALASILPPLFNEQIRIANTLVDRLTNVSGALSSVQRISLWRSSWAQFLEHPVTGSSLELRNFVTYPHNLVLESFMAVGLLGGLAFTVLTVMGLSLSFKLIKDDAKYGWVGLLLIQHTIAGMFSGALYLSLYLWYLLAAVAAASYAHRLNRTQDEAAEIPRESFRPSRKPVGVQTSF